MKKYTCPCYGFKTFSEKNGSYEICTVCFWQDDAVMNANPDYWGWC
ncbi:CPCC family cysteine-rich protein [Viridibacillus soli]|nr:CPCC family cysteine-rich protein [Viridibacillus soli]